MSLIIQNERPPQNAEPPFQEANRPYAHKNQTTKKVTFVVLALFTAGVIVLCALNIGAPLIVILPVFASILLYYLFTACLRWANEDSSSQSNLIEFQFVHDRPNYYVSEDFPRMVKSLGPAKFREKLEEEVPIQITDKIYIPPLETYAMICNKLTEMKADDRYFGPLPKLKQFFQEKWQGLSCSELAKKILSDSGQNITVIDHLEKSQILSSDQARLLKKAHQAEETCKALLFQNYPDVVADIPRDIERRKNEALAALDQEYAALQAL